MSECVKCKQMLRGSVCVNPMCPLFDHQEYECESCATLRTRVEELEKENEGYKTAYGMQTATIELVSKERDALREANSKGIALHDCEKHGKMYDRDWCPFCTIDDERRYKENCIRTIDDILKPEILALREVVEKASRYIEQRTYENYDAYAKACAKLDKPTCTHCLDRGELLDKEAYEEGSEGEMIPCPKCQPEQEHELSEDCWCNPTVDKPTCGQCGEVMQQVRPGKWQCDCQGGEK